MLDRDQEPSKEIRNYVKDRYAAAIQLIKNIEQRKQTILKVCQSIVRRQLDFLEPGIAPLNPMMIEEEDTQHPWTDEQITARLKSEGIDVTRRTVAKYREDMKIPSTHQRRVRA